MASSSRSEETLDAVMSRDELPVKDEWPREYDDRLEFRGKAIVINFPAKLERNNDKKADRKRIEENLKRGAEKDVEKLEKTFRMLQFTVVDMSVQITNKKTLLEYLQKVAKEDYHLKSESFLLVIMGLVKKNGMLHVYNEKLQVNEVWEIFTSDKCDPLAGKPKLYFFQAFLWEESITEAHEDVTIRNHILPKKKYSVPVESDFHIMYPTVEDAAAMGDTGSPFISCLCSVLEDDWYRDEEEKEPLQCLMTCLCKRMDRYHDQSDGSCRIVKEIPVIGSTLQSLMYFKHKLSSYEEQDKIEETEGSRKTQDDEQREYNLKCEYRGKAIIANFYKKKGAAKIFERKGSREDVERLKKTFKKLQFEEKEENVWDSGEEMTADWFDEKLKCVAKDKDGYLEKSECFVLVVMCHGGNNGGLCAFDKEFKVKDVWKKFTSQNCPSLKGKPKLFFFQACRGGDHSKETDIHRDGSASIPTEKYWIPDEKDILIMYPTFEGTTARRIGSPFVDNLCLVLDADFNGGGKEPIQILMTNVCNKVARLRWELKKSKTVNYVRKQMPTVISTLQHLLYFRKML